MTENLAEKISRYFVVNNMAKEDDGEVLSFMLFLIFSNVQQVFAFIVIAFIFNAFPHMIAFVIFFVSLKFQAGGAHANKHWVCFTVSTGLSVAVCLLCKTVDLPSYINIIVSAITFILVLLKAPVIHPNNPKPERRRKFMRKNSIIIAAIQGALIIAGSFVMPIISLAGALGGFAASVTLLLPVPENETE